MSVHVIKMPDIGEGIAEVELVAWYVQPGDAVSEDQVLADVMTDKATVEIPSPVVGTVQALGGAIGQVMAVGSELIRIEVAGVAAETAGKPAASPPAPSPPAPPAAAAKHPIERAALDAVDKPLASPAVRQRARQLGIDLRDVPVDSPSRHITHADLDRYALGARSTSKAHGLGLPGAESDAAEAIPVIGLRRKIAQKMQESKRRIPHYTYVEEVDVTELEALRARLNAKWSAERGRLTLLPLLARALVVALREFPQINARFDDEGGVVVRHAAVHLGIATQTRNGLMVPVLRHAETHSLWTSADEISRLAAAARDGSAKREELSGSTITLTSLGALGGIVSTPVINHPEVAIVGVNRIVERPVILRG
ncbi:MAG TPA: dihydrolipoamide acetyltransferase family protein, partial [Burkholderiaceae bacterium]|nr:dihydrolipoamide acetyltransferase family protein [Burkholderiaceae bacterium]